MILRLTASTVLLASLSAIPATAAERVYIAPGFSAGGAVYRPSKFWASGDATLLFRSIRWSHYGRRSASGAATGEINDCEPDCADGSMHTYPARIELTKVKRTCGRLFYTRLRIHWTGAVPPGLKRSYTFLPGVTIVC
jgi:hypothetical protein